MAKRKKDEAEVDVGLPIPIPSGGYLNEQFATNASPIDPRIILNTPVQTGMNAPEGQAMDPLTIMLLSQGVDFAAEETGLKKALKESPPGKMARGLLGAIGDALIPSAQAAEVPPMPPVQAGFQPTTSVVAQDATPMQRSAMNYIPDDQIPMEGRRLPTREQILVRQDWEGPGRGLAQGDRLPDGTMPVNMDGVRNVPQITPKASAAAENLIKLGANSMSDAGQGATNEIAKKDPPPKGGFFDTIKDFLGDEESMATLAIAFNSMRLNPDASLAAAMEKRIERADERRKVNRTAEAIAQMNTSQSKRAAEYLRATGDVKGAAKMAYGADANYGLTPQKIIDDQGNVKWVQLSSTGGIRDVELPAGYKVAPNVDKIDLGTEWLLIDQQGNPIGRQKKEIRQTELEKGLGQADVERASGARKTIQQSTAGIQLIDRILDPERSNSFDSVFGFLQGRLPTIRESAVEMEQELYQLGNQQFLAAFESLRGGGQISNIEGAKAQGAFNALFDRNGKLRTDISEEFAREQLGIIRDTMRKAAQRAEQNLFIDPNYNPDMDKDDAAYLRKAGEFAQSNPYAGFSIAR